MQKVILVRYGEIILKGLNRSIFEDRLIRNIKKSIHTLGKINVVKSQARIFIEPQVEDYDFETAIEKLTKVFGIVSLSIAWKITSDFDEIKNHSLQLVNNVIDSNEKDLSLNKRYTFKVETKRGDKNFPMKSLEISSALGYEILIKFPQLKVDVVNPSFTVYVEVRDHTYIYSDIISACGGLPVGANGKALLLLSGGIDSPVAGWMMGKRGLEIDAIHFYSYPYTSERAKDKVIKLAELLIPYCININLHIVPFTDIQLEINEKCPHEYMTIIMRRVMMKISERVAQSIDASALITGESLGQVASQTVEGIAVTDIATQMPVLRPLIGMDKNEIIKISRAINTFETSILPYEDCCTVFVSKHPNTKPKIDKVLKYEAGIDLEDKINYAIENTEIIKIR